MQYIAELCSDIAKTGSLLTKILYCVYDKINNGEKPFKDKLLNVICHYFMVELIK